jgi:hypothetical protein
VFETSCRGCLVFSGLRCQQQERGTRNSWQGAEHACPSATRGCAANCRGSNRGQGMLVWGAWRVMCVLIIVPGMLCAARQLISAAGASTRDFYQGAIHLSLAQCVGVRPHWHNPTHVACCSDTHVCCMLTMSALFVCGEGVAVLLCWRVHCWWRVWLTLLQAFCLWSPSQRRSINDMRLPAGCTSASQLHLFRHVQLPWHDPTQQRTRQHSSTASSPPPQTIRVL